MGFEGLCALLDDLGKHNDRDWFRAQQARFRQDVVEPTRAFVEEVGPRLRRFAPVVVDPAEVRAPQHRDRRFRQDAPPHWEHVLLRFAWDLPLPRRLRPAFALRLGPEGAALTTGLRDPGREVLDAVRRRIVDRPQSWTRVRHAVALDDGRSLQRVPKGFDAGHRHAGDLLRKDLTTTCRWDRKEVQAGGFTQAFVAACRHAAPLPRFVAEAMRG